MLQYSVGKILDYWQTFLHTQYVLCRKANQSNHPLSLHPNQHHAQLRFLLSRRRIGARAAHLWTECGVCFTDFFMHVDKSKSHESHIHRAIGMG
jgi:hypothetical protein